MWTLPNVLYWYVIEMKFPSDFGAIEVFSVVLRYNDSIVVTTHASSFRPQTLDGAVPPQSATICDQTGKSCRHSAVNSRFTEGN